MVKKTGQINGDVDVGVVLCDCGGSLRSRLDFEQLRKHLAGLPAVATVKLCSKFCRQNECTKAIKSISEKRVNRVVIGACDPENFDKNLREVMKSQALNQGLLWCVNIREHCGWVTSNSKKASNKAADILTKAVQRVKLATVVKQKKSRVNQNVLVLGGGIAAMQTAAALSRLGHHVTLVTKDEKLGGLVAKMPQLYAYVSPKSSDAEDLVQSRINELIEQVREDKQIQVQTKASLKSVKGELGNYIVKFNSNSSPQTVSAGAIVLATGSPASELGAQMAEFVHNPQNVPSRIAIVMDILGEQGKDVSAQVLSAAELLIRHFGAKVKLYCHNMRVAATGLENLYQRVREAGLVVAKYESPPEILDEGLRKVVRVEEPIVGKEISEEFDLVIIADAPTSAGNSEILSLIEGLREGPHHELQVDSVWLLPTKTNREGLFVAGSARSNSELRDAQTDGLATANQIHELLKNKQIELLDDAAVVDADKCVLCLTCMRICPHGAVGIDIDNGTASISAVDCQRCGICAAQCPAIAIQLPLYTDEQIITEVGDKPRITVFACENSAYPAATSAAVNGCEYNANIRLIRVPCAGKVDSRQVLQTLQRGAEKVMILGCHLENCQYLNGSTRAVKRIEQLNNTLEKAGINKKRVFFGQLASVEPGKFLEYMNI
ncbi:MAG: hydrogenase iron-sulfur subunit [Planctomycetota bacterium]